MFAKDRALLWHGTWMHGFDPSTMLLAMKAVQADLGLVAEWRQHCAENYDTDWLCYADYLEVELEIALDHMTDTTINTARETLGRIFILLDEIAKGVPLDRKILQRSATVKPVPLDVHVEVPGTVTARLSVHEESVKLEGWTFIPDAGYAGYFGEDANVEDVFDGNGQPVSEGETDSVKDMLNVQSAEGPFWRSIQEHLSENQGRFTVNWEE